MENFEIQEDYQTAKIQTTELDPWISMLTKPRETIQYIIDTNSTKYVILLAIIGGILNAAINAVREHSSLNEAVWSIFLWEPISSILYLYLEGCMIWLIGLLFKGKGSCKTIRAAFIWSILPGLWGLPLLIITIPLHFYNITWPLQLVYLFLGFWMLILSSKAIAQVQGFKSDWMGLLNLILAMFIPLLILVLAIRLQDFAPLK